MTTQPELVGRAYDSSVLARVLAERVLDATVTEKLHDFRERHYSKPELDQAIDSDPDVRIAKVQLFDARLTEIEIGCIGWGLIEEHKFIERESRRPLLRACQNVSLLAQESLRVLGEDPLMFGPRAARFYAFIYAAYSNADFVDMTLIDLPANAHAGVRDFSKKLADSSLERAEALYRRLSVSQPVPYSTEYASLLAMKANLLKSQGRKKEAKTALEQAKALTKGAPKDWTLPRPIDRWILFRS